MMFERSDDRFLAEIRGRLYVSVVSDVLDALGHAEQAMAARIRPLDDSLVQLVTKKLVDPEEAYSYAENKGWFEQFVDMPLQSSVNQR